MTEPYSGEGRIPEQPDRPPPPPQFLPMFSLPEQMPDEPTSGSAVIEDEAVHGSVDPGEGSDSRRSRKISGGEALTRGRSIARTGTGKVQEQAGVFAGAAARTFEDVRASRLWMTSRQAVSTRSAALVSQGREAVRASAVMSAATWKNGRNAYVSATAVPIDAQGAAKRPGEIIVAAVLGLVAPVFIVLEIIVMAVTGGRSLRGLGRVLSIVGDSAEVEAISTVGDISTGAAQALVGVGSVAAFLVILAFAVYSWRVLVGRGRARWLALAALVFSGFVTGPFNPILTALFILFGAASLVCAFLPRSTAWFRDRGNGS